MSLDALVCRDRTQSVQVNRRVIAAVEARLAELLGSERLSQLRDDLRILITARL